MSVAIILDNQGGPIYPGSLLQGKVECNFDSRKQIRSIKIRCYGKEHTQWNGGGKNNTRYYGTHYFFQVETKLYEPENHEIGAGRYKYPFSFVLPPSIPSTFEFPFGYIRYSLKAIVDIPLAPDPRTRIDLGVISVLDITSLPTDLRQPHQSEDQSLMGCCWFFNTDPVKMTARINKRVFLPGEVIKVAMEVENMSSDTVEDITVKLTRCFVAHSIIPRHDTRFINQDLLLVRLPGVGAHGIQSQDAELRIPLDIPIPNMTGCQFIESIYRVDVTGNTSGCNRDLNMVIAEIKIGHVDGTNWNTSNNAAFSQPRPVESQPSGYPYPSSDNGDNVWKPLLGADNNPSAPPPSYDDVTKRLPAFKE